MEGKGGQTILFFVRVVKPLACCGREGWADHLIFIERVGEPFDLCGGGESG